jgi:hypothetical protein
MFARLRAEERTRLPPQGFQVASRLRVADGSTIDERISSCGCMRWPVSVASDSRWAAHGGPSRRTGCDLVERPFAGVAHRAAMRCEEDGPGRAGCDAGQLVVLLPS